MTAGPVWHGSGIGWDNALNSFVTQLTSNYERFSGIKICSAESTLVLVSLYAPTHGKDDDFLDCMSHLTEFLLENISSNDAIIIGADSNCSSKSSPRRKKAWNAFCLNFSLKSHASSTPTFHHHNGSSNSCIDTILMSEHLKTSNLIQLCTLEDPTNLSSHDVLTTTMAISFHQRPKSKYEHTYTKFNREQVVWKEEHIPQ